MKRYRLNFLLALNLLNLFQTEKQELCVTPVQSGTLIQSYVKDNTISIGMEMEKSLMTTRTSTLVYGGLIKELNKKI